MIDIKQNFQPVSILSNLSKSTYCQINDFINNKLSKNIATIVKNIVHNHSKLNLLNMIEKWKGFLNKRNSIVPFFMDYSKAF